MAKITIYHNPNCGTSRNTLALIRERGTEPEAIEYLNDPPGRDAIVAHPILMNRPIVVTPIGTRLCRPAEAVLEILPDPKA